MIRLVLPFLLAAPLALAEPATIRVFEAQAHERADASSAVVHTFAESTEVSVSELSESGFRKIRLPDGRTAYVAESALAFPAVSTEAGAATKAPVANTPPSDAPLRSTAEATTQRAASIFIKDLAHLAEVVEVDQEVAPMARALATRKTTADVTVYGSLAAGAVVSMVGLFVMPKDNCSFSTFGDQSCTYGTANLAVIGAGTGLMLVGTLVGLVMYPSRNDLLDVLNAWNTRHPDEPFQLTGGSSTVGGQGR